MKAPANLKLGASGDTTTAASITYLQAPVRLLPTYGPLVVGIAPALSAPMLRAWQRIATRRGVPQQRQGQA